MLLVTPLNVISAPNAWAPLSVSYWTITGGIAKDIWGLLQIQDELGTRPYTAAVGATMQAVFQRGDLIGVAATGSPPTMTPNSYTVTKTISFDSQNRALVRIPLTAQDATNIISGTVVFTLTEGTTINKWVMNWGVKKLNTTAGL